MSNSTTSKQNVYSGVQLLISSLLSMKTSQKIKD